MFRITPGERYDMHGTTRNAAKLFPAAVEFLHQKYPEYDIVWDRQKERFLVIMWRDHPGRNWPAPVMVVEDEERGTYLDPSVGWIEKAIVGTDWRNSGHKDVDAFLDELESDERSFNVTQEGKVQTEERYCLNIGTNWRMRNPAFAHAPVGGWRPRHLASVTEALVASHRSQGGTVHGNTQG